MRLRLVLLVLAAIAPMLAGPGPSAAATVCDGGVCAEISATEVVLRSDVVERRWRRTSFVTTRFADLRPGGRSLDGDQPDFALLLDGLRLTSDRLTVRDVRAAVLPRGGIGIRFTLSLAGLVELVRDVEAYPGIAGISSRTTITPLLPLVLSGYTLDEVAAGRAAPQIHTFRAGGDWRYDEDWNPYAIGDPHQGHWRESSRAGNGKPLAGPGEWLSLTYPDGGTVFHVMERRDYASSRMSYDGATASALVDLSRDIIYIGPFEENAHVENPTPLPARHRVLIPGRPLEMERAFSGFGTDADDEPWQFHRYLTEHRLRPYQKAVTFNTNQVDENRISSGAKDDVDFGRFQTLAAAAREMGVETFVFDDGWQAISGDWCPDSRACPEPRAPDPKFRPRFPDAEFRAVREVLAGDENDPADDIALGLWMNPMEFHPASDAFRTSPLWTCLPIGLATAAVNLARPEDGSNEAGIGVWNPEALGPHPDTGEVMKLIDYIEERIRRMIEVYGATYFKFDFLVWADCVGIEPVDLYGYRDSFVAMIDRLQRDHPEVTYGIDETNDYRMFPYESVARGPSWFQNGTPETPQLLHNLWNLAPFVPGFSLGQHALGNSEEVAARGVDELMAVALGSHITFWTEIDTALTASQRAQVRPWTDFYKQHRDTLTSLTYPLLDDPLSGEWTALQPWNPDAGTGWLLAYRQDATDATQRIPLRGIRAGAYELTLVDPATGSQTPLGTFDASDLRNGVDVTIAETGGYAIIQIRRV